MESKREKAYTELVLGLERLSDKYLQALMPVVKSQDYEAIKKNMNDVVKEFQAKVSILNFDIEKQIIDFYACSETVDVFGENVSWRTFIKRIISNG